MAAGTQTVKLPEATRADLFDAAEDSTSKLFTALRDGKVTPEELEGLVSELLARSLDAVIPTGPLDAVDDHMILSATTALYRTANELLERDPEKMRARALRHRAKGNAERAARIEERADRVEARQGVPAPAPASSKRPTA